MADEAESDGAGDNVTGGVSVGVTETIRCVDAGKGDVAALFFPSKYTPIAMRTNSKTTILTTRLIIAV